MATATKPPEPILARPLLSPLLPPLLLRQRGASMPNESAFDVRAVFDQADQGNREPLGRLIDSMGHALYQVAWATLPSKYRSALSAEDLVQEANLMAIQDRASFRGCTMAQFRSWLFAITRHCSRDAVKKLRAKKRQAGEMKSLEDLEWSRDIIDPRQAEPETLARRQERRQILLALWPLLPLFDHCLMVWRDEGYSVAQMAKGMHRSRSSTQAYHSRGSLGAATGHKTWHDG